MFRSKADTWTQGFIRYFSEFDPTVQRMMQMRFLRCSLKPLVILCWLGCCFIVFNLISDSLYDTDGGCRSTVFIRSTIATAESTAMYQWVWISLCCISLFVVHYLLARLWSTTSEFKHSSKAVQHTVTMMCAIGSRGAAVANWRVKAAKRYKPNWFSISAFWALHTPAAAVLALPDFGYVRFAP